MVGRPAPDAARSRRGSSPSSSPTTACSAFATARAGRPSPAARHATWRRSPRRSRDRIRLGAPVHSVTRAAEHVEIARARRRAGALRPGRHRDPLRPGARDARATPPTRERELLGAIPYQRNEAVLHTDSTLLPRRRAARSAWNFHLLREPKPLSTVTYYMNHLQRLRADRDFCVTLNRTEAIDPAKIIRTIAYAHPVYTPRGRRRAGRARGDQRAADAHALLRRLLGLGLSRGRRASARCAPASRSG